MSYLQMQTAWTNLQYMNMQSYPFHVFTNMDKPQLFTNTNLQSCTLILAKSKSGYRIFIKDRRF